MMHFNSLDFNRFFNFNILLKFVIVISFLKAIHGKTNKVIIIINIIIINNRLSTVIVCEKVLRNVAKRKQKSHHNFLYATSM